MLVLSRRAGESVQIGEHVAVTIVRIAPGVVRLGIEAPVAMPVMREEVRQAMLEEEHGQRVAHQD